MRSVVERDGNENENLITKSGSGQRGDRWSATAGATDDTGVPTRAPKPGGDRKVARCSGLG
jgi:hypothetical protein